MNRAKTKEEVRDEFMDSLARITDYWSNIVNISKHEISTGMVISILNLFDNGTGIIPALNISLAPHPDDKEYYQRKNQDWYENGMIINDDCNLNELFIQKYKSV